MSTRQTPTVFNHAGGESDLEEASMDRFERLRQMVEELWRMREDCEPKNNGNPRYHKYSNAGVQLAVDQQ
jgi:hypothetical protein